MDLSNSIHLWAARTRWLKKRLPGLPETVYVPLPGGRRIYADAHDVRGPSFHVMYGGLTGFEHYELAEKNEILSHLPDNGTFIDIGANIGLFSLYVHWQKPGSTIHAFEPHPRNIACLKRSCEANRIQQIHPHASAIGDQVGELELFFNDTDSGGHSAYRSMIEDHLGSQPKSARVPLTTLDAFADEQRLARVDVIKIDTQGGEASAIRGAKRTFARFKPALLIEIDYRFIIDKIDSPLRALQDTGTPYRARRVGEKTSIDLNQLEELAKYELNHQIYQRNFVFEVQT